MTTDTDIVNAALRLIGGTRITSLTDGTNNANVAGDLYETLRDSLLRSHAWNFATRRVKLARSSTVPNSEYDYAYPLPADWLRTVEVFADDEGAHPINDYTTELVANQRAILSDEEDVYLRYIARVEDVNLWHTDFVEALQFALARDLALPVASSNTMRETFRAEAKSAIGRAKSADALDSPARPLPRGSWAAARGGRRPFVTGALR